MRWTQTKQKLCALIPGAGSGTRMKHPVKKLYRNLEDKPVLAHTIGALDRISVIDSIFVIVDSSDFEMCQSSVISPYGFRRVKNLVGGGLTRQASVFNGLKALPSDTEFVIVHDGARPFVPDTMIFNCLEAAEQWGAAAIATPVKDTIKIANDNGFISTTPDRQQLWSVQTPQVFRASVLLEAHQRAQRKEITATDDATLVEQIGCRVKLVMGSYTNVKITTPEDLIIAHALKRTLCA